MVGTVSFQAVDSSNSFLRHRGYLIYQDNFSDSALFRKDVCFYPRANRFFTGYTAYESVKATETTQLASICQKTPLFHSVNYQRVRQEDTEHRAKHQRLLKDIEQHQVLSQPYIFIWLARV